jgi:hypothetical protein
MVFVSPSKQMLDHHPKLGHILFLQYAFHFIIDPKNGEAPVLK